jgi:hypothetical protein
VHGIRLLKFISNEVRSIEKVFKDLPCNIGVVEYADHDFKSWVYYYNPGYATTVNIFQE